MMMELFQLKLCISGFFGCISTPISYTNWLLPTYLLFQIALSLSLQAYYYYDEDCTLSHERIRNRMERYVEHK